LTVKKQSSLEHNKLNKLKCYKLKEAIIPTPAVQYKDHGNSANPASARQQMIISAMVKSPEHQQGPTNLAPSNSERRKATATPEGE